MKAATESDLAAAAEIISRGAEPSAQSVFLGDKALLFNDSRTAFVSYGKIRCSWIAAGDPVGPPAELSPMIEAFARAAAAAGAWPAIYKITPRNMHAYLEHNFLVGKVGEMARVPARDFTLDGSRRRRLRRSQKQARESGVTCEVIPARDVGRLLPELKPVSDDWLRQRRGREKGFSLGAFDAPYLSRFPSVIARVDGKIAAFATIWSSDSKRELEIDLMRSRADAPSGTMHAMLVDLIAWAGREGYDSVSLGMSPLAGVSPLGEGGRVQPLRRMLTRLSGRFYNFEGLREFKQSFDPEWEPRYLASSPGIARSLVLAHLAALTSGGIAGMFRK
ncbi:MAG TPA: phosphatidylglycerol lysyltransferase domain-containing protein [Gemmatimonadaceae bacterium]|nr:phosphatidylglycerol lysyltransferase domain-containing protein [Gemmatimonadaceae bacterium]